MPFTHAVPRTVRDESRWDPTFNVYVTPDGRTWQFVDPNIARGAATVDGEGQFVTVARWVHGQEHLPFDRCLTDKAAKAWEEFLRGN